MKACWLIGLVIFCQTPFLNADEIKSGPQVGEKVRAFQPLHVTGLDKGKKRCLVCKSGNNPAVMIFARSITDEVTALIKRLDSITGHNEDGGLISFVVFLSDDPDMESKLRDLAKRERIQRTTLALDTSAGPDDYKLPKEASVTVVLFVQKDVKANFVFSNGSIPNDMIETILDEVGTKILAVKK
jgi:hypothetical protein